MRWDIAKGKKTGGKDFEPGKPGGPGRPPDSPQMKEFKKLTKVEFINVVNKYLGMTKEEIKQIQVDPNSTMLELLVASIIVKGFNQGDASRLQFFLDRTIGPIKTKIEHSGPEDGPIKIDENLSEEELDRRAAKIMQRLKDKFKS